jgi:thiamine-monophosphate kinase
MKGGGRELVRVGDLGEFGLIKRLDAIVRESSNPRLLFGIGDDAAAWEPEPGTVTVATTDCLIEGVHFDLATTSWTDLGWKALAENLSDVAAMGCRPRYALIGLALPNDRLLEDAEALYRGFAQCGAEYNCSIVGGDTVASPIVSLHVTVVGESLPSVDEPRLLKRSSAQPGDSVAVTGPLGGSAAGLRLLQRGPGREARRAPDEALIESHLRPRPRVIVGLALVEAGIRCAIDVSDGLLADLGHICERSYVNAEIDLARIPIDPAVVAEFRSEATDFALSGGEDYELIAVGPEACLEQASTTLSELGEPALIIIGTIVSSDDHGTVQIRNADGQPLKLGRAGYEHFAIAKP